MYIASGATVGVMNTRIFGNHASTSNDDVFGVLNIQC
jgi:hypothetical protein